MPGGPPTTCKQATAQLSACIGKDLQSAGGPPNLLGRVADQLTDGQKACNSLGDSITACGMAIIHHDEDDDELDKSFALLLTVNE